MRFRVRSPKPLSPGRARRVVHRGAAALPWMVRVFYLLTAYRLFEARAGLRDYFQPDTELIPLWPVFWADWVRADQAALAVGILLATSALLAILLPHFRWIRLIFAFALLQYLGLNYSFGKIGHGTHLVLWISIILIFLPRGYQRPRSPGFNPVRSVAMLSIIQLAIALSYTLSGLWKAVGALWQAAHGHIQVFHPRALELHLASRVLQTQESPPLTQWTIENSSWLWPLLPLTVLVQLLALPAAFRPRLHLPLGLLLLGMHLFISLTMGIHFRDHFWLLLLFFVASPLQYQTGWKDFFRDLRFFSPPQVSSNRSASIR